METIKGFGNINRNEEDDSFSTVSVESNKVNTTKTHCKVKVGRVYCYQDAEEGCDGQCKNHYDFAEQLKSARLAEEQARIAKQVAKETAERIKSEEESKRQRRITEELETSIHSYDSLKIKFEEHTFQTGKYVFSWSKDYSKFELMKPADVKSKFEHWRIKTVDIQSGRVKDSDFYSKWKTDEKKKVFEDGFDFYPHNYNGIYSDKRDDNEEIKEKVTTHEYNIFSGFNAEKFSHYKGSYTEEEKNKVINTLKTHINYLVGNNDYNTLYLLIWLADMIQKPYRKSQVGILIRDMGNMLKEGGGTGKNLFFDWFGNHILGKKYYCRISDNAKMFEKFNSMLCNKIFVFVEEAEAKSNMENYDKIKPMISADSMRIEFKGVDAKDVLDYSRWLFGSNNKLPMAIRQGDRRLCAFDTNPVMRNNKEYFDNLVSVLDDNKNKWIFYEYLMNMDLTGFKTVNELQNKRPITPTYVELRRICAPNWQKWFVDQVENHYFNDEENFAISILYNYFKMADSDSRKESTMSLMAFSQFITSDKSVFDYEMDKDGITKVKYNGQMKIKFTDYDGVIQSLKNLHILDKDFKRDKEKEKQNKGHFSPIGPINI